MLATDLTLTRRTRPTEHLSQHDSQEEHSFAGSNGTDRTDPPASGDPDLSVTPLLSVDEAESLGERIQQQAAMIAEATCQFLLMVSDFDAGEGSRVYYGLKSTAHWLSWACSMSPGTAREHVRVARALPSLPLTVEEFSRGRLSYSKVREITRVYDQVEEELLVNMARSMTASQLARTISSFRAHSGTAMRQESFKEARWDRRDDGMVEIRAVLPAETGAEVVTALEHALEHDGSEPDSSDPLEQRRADAVHAVARAYLAEAPTDITGEDRHLVIVNVDAQALVESTHSSTETATGSSSAESASEPPEPVSPKTPGPEAAGYESVGWESAEYEAAGAGVGAGNCAHDEPAMRVAGTRASDLPTRCSVRGGGGIESSTAERLACSGRIRIAVTGDDGEVLYLGGTKRLASPAQRRALRLRSSTCSFPGCHQTRHLDIHHVTAWSEGGPTDLDQLALLCRRHHVLVHEGGLRLRRRESASRFEPLFDVVDAHDRRVEAHWPPFLEQARIRLVDGEDADAAATPECASETDQSASESDDPERIAATTGGYGFRLIDCVNALLENVEARVINDEQAA